MQIYGLTLPSFCHEQCPFLWWSVQVSLASSPGLTSVYWGCLSNRCTAARLASATNKQTIHWLVARADYKAKAPTAIYYSIKLPYAIMQNQITTTAHADTRRHHRRAHNWARFVFADADGGNVSLVLPPEYLAREVEIFQRLLFVDRCVRPLIWLKARERICLFAWIRTNKQTGERIIWQILF